MVIAKENNADERMEGAEDSEPMLSKALEAQGVTIKSEELEVIVEDPGSAAPIITTKVRIKVILSVCLLTTFFFFILQGRVVLQLYAYMKRITLYLKCFKIN